MNWPWALFASLSTEVQLLLDAKGRVIQVGVEGPKVLGFAVDPAASPPVHDFFAPEAWPHLDAMLARLLATPGKMQEETLQAHTKDGKDRWLQVKAINHLADPNVAAIAVVYRDVTARHIIAASAKEQGELSEAFLATVDALVLVVRPDGEIVRFNRACERATGYLQEEVLGQRFQDLFFPSNERPGVMAELGRILANGSSKDYENYWHTRAGERLRIAWTSRAVANAGGASAYVIGTGLDVTEQRQSEAAVKAHLRFLRGLGRIERVWQRDLDLASRIRATVGELLPLFSADRAFVGRVLADTEGRLEISAQAYLEDAQPRRLEGQTVDLPPAIAHQFRDIRQGDRTTVWHVGLSPPDVDDFLREYGLQSLMIAPLRVREGGDWYVGVSRIRVLPAWPSSEIELFAEIARRLAETLVALHLYRGLQESAAQFRELAETVPDIVWTANSDGGVQFFNQRWYQATGLTEDASKQWGWLTAVHRDDVADVHATWLGSMQSGKAWEYNFRLQHQADNDFHWYLARARPLLDDHGQPLRWFASLTDIDQQRRTEEALHASQQQLRQAQKMEAIGRLAGGVAHDFNNLLTAINGYSDLILSSMAEDDSHRNQLVEIRRAGERAAQLTGQLLAFSRKQVLAPQQLNLATTLREMDRLLRRLIGEHIALETLIDGEPLLIRADPGQIEQVILNLVLNARDAMQKGGKLQLRAGRVEVSEMEAMALQVNAGSWVELWVSDTGRGMNEHVRQRLFEPFFTTKQPGQGTGLGLATVYAVLQQCGAAIEVDSAPGKGARFRLLFPVCADDGSATPLLLPHHPHPGATLSGNEHILVVEDDPAVLKLTVDILRSLGYQVHAVQSASQATKTVKRLNGLDLLLTDVVLVGESGYDLAQRLWANHPDLPVLFMSGYTDDEVFRRGVRDLRHAFLAKPFTPQTLARKVREVLRAHQQIKPPSAQEILP